jgi:hypothetical protein
LNLAGARDCAGTRTAIKARKIGGAGKMIDLSHRTKFGNTDTPDT